MADVKEFLEHYGVKGQKWGVRKDRGHVGERVKTKKLAKLDKKWQKNIYTTRGAIDVHNNIADRMNNGGIQAFNNKHWRDELAGLPDSDPRMQRYMNAYARLTEEYTRDAVRDVHGTSPSGRLQATLDTSGPQWQVRVVEQEVRHTAGDTFIFDVYHDNNRIISMSNVRTELVQSMNVEEFLEHYGVKGMKWGKRKARGTSRTTYGKSPKNLTKEELERRIRRMETEKRYNDLNRRDVSAGQRLASDIITNVGRQAATTLLTGAAVYIGREAIRRANPALGEALTPRRR